MTTLTFFFDYEEVAKTSPAEADLKLADRMKWNLPLYPCPLCNLPVGTIEMDGKTRLDEHYFDLNGHWRECDASWAIAELTFNGVASRINKISSPPEESTSPSSPIPLAVKSRRPSRSAKARRRRYTRSKRNPAA